MEEPHIPPLAEVLARNMPHHGVYVVGGHALKQWVNADWKGDVDLMLIAGKCTTAGYDHRLRRAVRNDNQVITDVVEMIFKYRYADEPSQPSECPPCIWPVMKCVKEGGAMAAGVNIGPHDVPIHIVNGDKHVYDIFSTEVADVRMSLTQLFDLNICAIGYRVVPWDLQKACRAMGTFFAVAKRMKFNLPLDVRRYLAHWVMETAPQPTVCRQWIFGEQFDDRAAHKEPGTYAIFQWQRCSVSEKGGAMTMLHQGMARAQKYRDRGYQLAETPPRTLTPEFGEMVHDSVRYRAEQKYEEEKREAKRLRVFDLMKDQKRPRRDVLKQ